MILYFVKIHQQGYNHAHICVGLIGFALICNKFKVMNILMIKHWVRETL